MGKNDFLKKRDAVNRALLDAGQQVGMQMMFDLVIIALHDPELMGKDTFGKKRAEKLAAHIKKTELMFQEAFTTRMEADVRRRDMDSVLREVWGKDLVPFEERYPDLKREQYDKPKKRNKHNHD